MPSGMRGRKMNKIYEWIRSLVSFMILMTALMNLLPDKKYEKYVQLFAGMVFLHLFFSPLTDLSGLEAQMAGAFERITFQTDARLLKKEIEDLDGTRIQRLISQYEMTLEQELRRMAESVEAECMDVQVVMETDPDQEKFGRLRAVDMTFDWKGDSDVEQVRNVNRQIAELRKRIGEQYGMEEGNITIIIETE